MAKQEVSASVIRRLPRYYRFLGDLKEKGKVRVSSGELSDALMLTASQIRQDFNHFVNLLFLIRFFRKLKESMRKLASQ